MEMSAQIHTPAALLPGKESCNPFNRSLGGSQSQFRRDGEERNSLHSPCRESDHGRPVHCLITTLTELSQVIVLQIYSLGCSRKCKIKLQMEKCITSCKIRQCMSNTSSAHHLPVCSSASPILCSV